MRPCLGPDDRAAIESARSTPWPQSPRMPGPSLSRATSVSRPAPGAAPLLARFFRGRLAAVLFPLAVARAGPEDCRRTLAAVPSACSLHPGAGRTRGSGRRGPKRRVALLCPPPGGWQARESYFRSLCISCQTPAAVDGLTGGFHLHPAAELLEEQGAAAVQARPHCPYRTTQGRRSILVAHFVQVAQNHSFAVMLGQAQDR